MKILGYSERGIINSLIFSIGESPELMTEFIRKIKLPKSFELGNPENYTILLEQSFSRFGDADLIIIIHYKKPEDKKVLFIEGKVKTSQGSWKIQTQFDKYVDEEQYETKEKYNGYSSNLFFQLYLKKLLIDYSAVYKNVKDEKGIEEPKFGDFRKIGKNKVVLDAFELLKCKKENTYYVGLIPTLVEDIKKFNSEELDYTISYLSWETVEQFCRENELEKVIEIFEYNKGQIYSPNL